MKLPSHFYHTAVYIIYIFDIVCHNLRYKVQPDGYRRLETIRYESIEVSQQVLGTSLSPAHAGNPGLGSPAHPAHIAPHPEYPATLQQDEGGSNYLILTFRFKIIIYRLPFYLKTFDPDTSRWSNGDKLNNIFFTL